MFYYYAYVYGANFFLFFNTVKRFLFFLIFILKKGPRAQKRKENEIPVKRNNTRGPYLATFDDCFESGSFLRIFMREVTSGHTIESEIGTVLTWGHS